MHLSQPKLYIAIIGDLVESNWISDSEIRRFPSAIIFIQSKLSVFGPGLLII